MMMCSGLLSRGVWLLRSTVLPAGRAPGLGGVLATAGLVHSVQGWSGQPSTTCSHVAHAAPGRCGGSADRLPCRHYRCRPSRVGSTRNHAADIPAAPSLVCRRPEHDRCDRTLPLARIRPALMLVGRTRADYAPKLLHAGRGDARRAIGRRSDGRGAAAQSVPDGRGSA